MNSNSRSNPSHAHASHAVRGPALERVPGEFRQRAWMRLPSGARLDLVTPHPVAWTDHDLAVRLARTYRWGGESCWPRPLSVAQHSLSVLALANERTIGRLSPGEALRELLHDAEEAFLGFDCISPLKRALGKPLKTVSDRLMHAVEIRYDLPAWSTGEDKRHRSEAYAFHKRADTAEAAS